MNVNGIGSARSTNVVMGASPESAGGVAGAGLLSTSDPSLSTPGQLMSTLQELQVSDPAQAQQVLSDLARRFRTEAAGAADGSGKLALAERFEVAAQSGDLSGLLPQPDPTAGPQSSAVKAYGQVMAVTRSSR